MSLKITDKAYAKLNLYLDITGKRDDGYHNIESIMQQIDWYDLVTVAVSEGDEIKITCDNDKIPHGKKNIAYKCCSDFLISLNKTAKVDIHIQKNIPTEAGLGGGSADGACVLKCLNKLFGQPFSDKELCLIGSKSGADIPFCIVGGTALCEGIGEIITPLKPITDCFFLVIIPDFKCNTKNAYDIYDKNPLPKYEKSNAGAFYNCFQKLYNNIDIENYCSKLTDLGAKKAMLTGSGSAIFGVFDKLETAKNAFAQLDAPFKIISKPINNT